MEENTNKENAIVRQFFTKRAKERVLSIPSCLLNILIGEKFYIAGGAMIMNKPNDIDIYAEGLKNDLINSLPKEISFVSKTMNAYTFNCNGIIVQVCLYYKETLKALVDSFDFAHIKVGARFDKYHDINEIYISEDYKTSSLIGSTFYTGSDFPLSSMIRINKYIERGCFVGKSYIPEIIKIMSDIYDRGFEDYDDFKDQLDAVDLGLIPSEISQITDASDIFYEFFELLNKGK